MSQQFPHGSANDKYKRRLFVDNGFDYQEVKARIIEPYTNPTPQMNSKEIKLINAPSHFHQMGVASYKSVLTLLFEDKESYTEYMAYVGWGHKFYDERGAIYLGTVESIKTTSVEAQKRFKVEVSLMMIKKSQADHHKNEILFQDISPSSGFYDSVVALTRLGVIQSHNDEGQPTIYFNPNADLTRVQLVAFMMRTKRLLDKMLMD
ncbi:S-layer homology domain-containing protein [Solibacillus silvestris]